MINFAIDEVSNPRLGAERSWLALLKGRGVRPGETTVVMRDHA